MQPAAKSDHGLQRSRRLLAGKQMFDTADVQQVDRIRQVRQSLQPRIGDKESPQSDRQLRQLFELLALTHAQRRESRGQLADALQRSTAIEAELLQAFGQTVHFDQTGIIEVQALDAGRYVGQRLERRAVIEHQALQPLGQALRQTRQRGRAVQVDGFDAVRQRDADVEEVAAASYCQSFHG